MTSFCNKQFTSKIQTGLKKNPKNMNYIEENLSFDLEFN